MNRALGLGLVFSGLVLSAGVLAPTACDSSPAKGTGGTAGAPAGATGGGGATATAGTTGQGGATGAAGAGGATSGGGAGGVSGAGGGGGTAGGIPFMAVNPCNSADAYTTTGTTIAYGGPNLKYAPKCLKVAAGSQVTFAPATSDDSFSVHPLNQSTRGTLPSPITETLTGVMKTFTFATPGFYAYYCEFHGSADDGNNMAGVVWVD